MIITRLSAGDKQSALGISKPIMKPTILSKESAVDRL